MATGNPVGISQEVRIVSPLTYTISNATQLVPSAGMSAVIRPCSETWLHFKLLFLLTATTVPATYIYGGAEVADLHNQVTPVVFASKELSRLLCDTSSHHT